VNLTAREKYSGGRFCFSAYAVESDYFKIYKVSNAQLDFGTWSLVWAHNPEPQRFVFRRPTTATPTPIRPRLYLRPRSMRNTISVYRRATIARATFFYLDRDGNNTGNARLSFSLEHIDTLSGNNWETLNDNVFDSHNHSGQFKGCNDGENSGLRITLSATNLENVCAGPYRAKLQIEGAGGSSQSATDSDIFRADIIVSDIVRVSGLSDIAFGIHTPGSDQVGERTFCVYSNSYATGYNVSISSSNQDAGGNFFLKSPDDTIPYDVYFKDSTVAGFGTPVFLGAIPGNGNNAASNCGGSNNAKLSVSVGDSDIVPSKTGNYSDTLTLLIAPL
jgi:hypothetical protein